MMERFVPPGTERSPHGRGGARLGLLLLLLLLAGLGRGLLAPGRTLAQTAGPTPTPAPAGVPTPVPVPPGAPQLSVSKAVQPTSGPVGSRVTFTILVSNIGAGDAHDVSVTDVVPDAVQVLSANTTRGTVTITGQTVQATIGTLAPGEVVTVTITGVIRVGTPTGAPIHNTVQAVASDAPQATAGADLLPVTSELPKSGAGPDGWLVLGLLLLAALLGAGWALRPAHQMRADHNK